MGLRDLSIERKVLLLIVPICLIPALVFVYMFAQGSRATFTEAMGSKLGDAARSQAESFDQFLERRVGYLVGLTTRRGISVDQIAQEARLGGQVDAVAMIERAQQVSIPGNGPENIPKIVRTSTSFFSRSWESREKIPETGMIEDIQVAIPGRMSPLRLLVVVLPLATPMEDEPTRLLCFFYEAEHFLSQFLLTYPGTSDPLVVISRNGHVIRAPEFVDEEWIELLRGQTHNREWLEGHFPIEHKRHPYVLGLADSKLMKQLRPTTRPSAVWTFILIYDMQYFLAPHEERISLAILIALGLVLVLVGLASGAAHAIVRPLRQLRVQADELSRGNLDVQADVLWRDEIGELAESFNRMAGRLRATYRSLEERIDENRMRADHINAINEIANAIIQSRSLDDIFDILSHETQKILQFDAMWLAVADPSDQNLRVMHIEPKGMISLFERGRVPIEGSHHGRVASRHHAIHLELKHEGPDETFEAKTLRPEGLSSLLIAPLPARERMIGTLTVASGVSGAYNDSLALILASLARAVAISIDQAELFQRISHFAAELERKVAERTTELEQATRKLIQTEKYFATGRMAGNLAHEINNPLGIIKNYLYLVRAGLRRAGGGRRKTDPHVENLDIIDDEVNRIASLVNQLLNLHRPVEQKVKPVDINEMIRSILKIMDGELSRHEIDVKLELTEDLPRPIASPDLIRQLLINLMRNAQDAMERGGELLVRTSNVGEWDGEDYVQVVRIRVEDTGVGIAAEDLSQIFDPFFTTKPQEKGTGLGLCVSYSIVRMYGGTIDAQSTVGVGTKMIVSLPMLVRYEQAARVE